MRTYASSGDGTQAAHFGPVPSSPDTQRCQFVNCNMSPGVARTAITFRTRHPRVDGGQFAPFVMLPFARSMRGFVHWPHFSHMSCLVLTVSACDRAKVGKEGAGLKAKDKKQGGADLQHCVVGACRGRSCSS